MARAVDARQTVRVACQYCNIKRYYDPADLLTLCGDKPVEAVRMRCERCGMREFLRISLYIPAAEERQALTLRRLVGVRYLRKVIWRDESS
ncbi:hypothetical protein [Mesorhizobium sp. NBSH29]|uniref:hypothetical protein n=1 Tax=Mesorhizobium sp. NBSH29 TaxID=2654249 RepID=UPI0021565090|nr:hypothetical protein [Mesorhizobium sp. NBSH29]